VTSRALLLVPALLVSAAPAYAANQMTGTDGDDHLTGTGGRDHVVGLRGDDVLRGGAGGDEIDGGPGADRDPADRYVGCEVVREYQGY
jgi:hypothetical protein